MDELINRLEHQIKKLADQYGKLKDSNQELDSGKASLAREKDALLARQLQAISQIQTLVNRLKTIET